MKVGLFIPCYINAVYPHIGVACYKLLTSLGIEVDYPLGQTCCGQPMANAGFEKDSLTLAKRFEQLFKDYTYVVGPSASCVAFVKENHPRILSEHGEHVCETSKRIYDITEFLHDVVKPEHFASHFPHKETIHAGFDPAAMCAVPDRGIPVDAMRWFEKQGKFGKLHDHFYVTVGTGTTQAFAAKFGREIAQELHDAKVDAVVLTAT